MRKYYRLKKELPTFREGDLFVLKEDGCLYSAIDESVMAYHARTLARFPRILGDWFEEVESLKAYLLRAFLRELDRFFEDFEDKYWAENYEF